MSLVNLKELLADAEQRNYAVGAYNVFNLEMVRAVIAAAEKMRSPVILAFAQVHLPLVSFEQIAPIILAAAQKAQVPVATHLDHGRDQKLLEQAMKLGFTSVMFDGSDLPFAENIRQTKIIVEYAGTLGISVEAELGIVAGTEDGSDSQGSQGSGDSSKSYTDPDQAKVFARETGIDALAVAFGTAHGVYLEKPVLDFQRLEQIKKMTGLPLVMHGGSGLADNAYQKSIECGIRKINYYSTLGHEVANKVKVNLGKREAEQKKSYYHDIVHWAMDTIEGDVSRTMVIFGCAGKA